MTSQIISQNIIDQIGYWSEIKLEIIKKYAQAYSTILSAQRKPHFKHVYVDAFAGTGIHQSKTTGEYIPGSPLNALNVNPPFEEYYFVDSDHEKVEVLKSISEGKDNVYVYEGDCNKVLIQQIYPKIRYEDYKRGLCFLDPYGLHLEWDVIQKAGKTRTLDIFLNFPLYDMNLNVLLCDPEKASEKDLARMNQFWGDCTWKDEVYIKQLDIFGKENEVKTGIQKLVKAFQKKLKNEAGFSQVPEPIPMKNEQGGTLYYLYFASQKEAGAKIARDLFRNYRVPGL